MSLNSPESKSFALPKPLQKPMRRLLEAGTYAIPTADKKHFIALNIVGYMASLTSLNYAITYAAHDYNNLKPLVFGNIISAVLTACVPFFHRFGRLASVYFLVSVIFVLIYYFISILGRDAGIQLHYIGASAVIIVVAGEKVLRYTIPTIFIAAILHLLAWFQFPTPRQGLILSKEFIDFLYIFSTFSITAVISIVVFYAYHQVRQAQARADALLYNIMPQEIADRLKVAPNETIADRFKKAHIIFADMTGFTNLTSMLGPLQTTELLNDLYSEFDKSAAAHNVEKIKTIGDAYMAVAGIPTPNKNDTENIANMAVDFMKIAQKVSGRHGVDFGLRIGIASGPIMAGIIGKDRFAYDVWGDAVNLAARLEPIGDRGHIMVDDTLRDALVKKFDFKPVVDLDLKGIGKVTAWLLETKTK